MTDQSNQHNWAWISAGDAGIWREFLNREIPQLYGMFMRRWPNPTLAEELVQKTVFDAVRGRDSYEPTKGSPEEWIFGIARNNIRLELKLWPDKKGTVATTYVRYKHADTSAVTEFKSPMAVEDFNKNFDGSSNEFQLAATVAEFAEILRKSYWAKGATLERVLERAQQLSREFKDDTDVIELVDLISKAKQLMKKVEVEPVETEEE